MNITQLQSVLAPILAPIAPAVLFGNNLYKGMLADKIDPTFALISATGGTLGVELSGALACSMAVLAYHKHDFKIMWVSIISALIYAGFVFNGITTSGQTSAYAGAIFISLIAYLMLGVYQSYQYKLSRERDEANIEISVLDARRKLVNSETRAAKIVQPVQSVHIDPGQPALNPEILAKVCEHLAQNPAASLRDLVKIPGIGFTSPETARKYKKAAEEMLR